jgi:hypothetical protein
MRRKRGALPTTSQIKINLGEGWFTSSHLKSKYLLYYVSTRLGKKTGLQYYILS